MLVTETKSVTRDLYVAPCLKCGCKEIVLSDSNYSSFNRGGGTCSQCKHEVVGCCGCLPTVDDLARIWNNENDIDTLIAIERKKITTAYQVIKELVTKKAIVGGDL